METRPGNTERGWNDPPEFMHTGAPAPVPSHKRSFLNKRVAYPGIVSGDSSSLEPSSGPSSTHGCTPPLAADSILPPLGSTSPPVLSAHSPSFFPTNSSPRLHNPDNSANIGLALNPASLVPSSNGGVILFPPASTTDVPRFTAPIIVPTMSPKEDSPLTTSIVTIATNPITNAQVNTEKCREDLDIPDFDSDEQMFHFVVTRLQKTCVDCLSVVKPRVADDINRKLDVFSKMWKEGKISYPVKSSMARLATALHRRKCDIAHGIHLSLMMDYVSEVGQWMVGIKRLIQEARNTEAPLSPTNSAVDPLVSNMSTTQETLERVSLTEECVAEGASDNTNSAPIPVDECSPENVPATVTTNTDGISETSLQQNDSTHDVIDNGPAIIATSPIAD